MHQPRFSHGHACNHKPSSEWLAWKTMRERCRRKSHKFYALYGGRGITVCERWDSSFEEFLKDMGQKPPGTSLDRIDNDGPYSPENCRWATMREQNRNKRNNVLITIDSQTRSLAHWVEEYGVVDYQTARARIQNYGWCAYRSVTEPSTRPRSSHR